MFEQSGEAMTAYDVDLRELTDLSLRSQLLLEAIDGGVGCGLVDASLPCLTTGVVSLVLSLCGEVESASSAKSRETANSRRRLPPCARARGI